MDWRACISALRADIGLLSSCVCAVLLCMVLAAWLVAAVPLLGCISKHGKVLEFSDSSSKHYWHRWLYVPKFLFTHMYAWGLLLNAALFEDQFSAIMSLTSSSSSSSSLSSSPPSSLSSSLSRERMLLLLFTAHLLRRLLECIFMTFYGNSRMHVAGLVVGLLHYTICSLCILSLFPTATANAHRSAFGCSMGAKVAAMCLFLLANCFQYSSHKVLYQTKKKMKAIRSEKSSVKIMNTKSGEMEEPSLYAVPEGILFSYVCCPHYTSEVLIYVSMCVLCPCPAMLSLVAWVASNLAVVSFSQYDFYSAQFKASDGYPFAHTKRIIPFIL